MCIRDRCNHHRVPLTVRGAGTGYTGGAVPSQGGILLAMERFNRIIEIDQVNLLAIVEPNVVTGELQKVVESIGLFYPPDPASLNRCAIGGNIAECAGGPRAFKYGTTKRYVLGLEAVLATGEVIHTGGKTVKNVVGYDLTQTLVGSEGTLAIVTKAILRLIPLPPCRETVQATFRHVDDAVGAMIELVKARVIPSALELIDLESLEAVARYLDDRTLAPAGTAASPTSPATRTRAARRPRPARRRPTQAPDGGARLGRLRRCQRSRGLRGRPFLPCVSSWHSSCLTIEPNPPRIIQPSPQGLPSLKREPRAKRRSVRGPDDPLSVDLHRISREPREPRP